MIFSSDPLAELIRVNVYPLTCARFTKASTYPLHQPEAVSSGLPSSPRKFEAGRAAPRRSARTALLAVFALIALLVCIPSGAGAQAVNNAQIHGVVQDSTGAVVPGAQVKATETNTARVQTAISGADGSYVLPDLSVGEYKLEVSAANFSRVVQTGIVLQVGQNVQVNVQLKVGNVSQEVHVSADAAMVETQNTSVSEVIDQHRIVDLPLNGRQVTDLIVLIRRRGSTAQRARPRCDFTRLR